MSRKATDRVTTIGIDIGKNGFHLIGLDGRLGSKADSRKARPSTNQSVLSGCTPLVAVRRFQPLHRDRSSVV